MPAILAEPSQRNDQIRQALKTYIMRERQRKKQEQEADEEEERLRKERELQQKQDVMTFGETRDQINNLQNEILKLQTEKHELFTELKRVLFEEGNRKRQLLKEDNIYSEVPVGSYLTGGYATMNNKVMHPQLLLPTARDTSPLYEPSVPEPQVLTTGSSMRTFSPPSVLSMPYHSSYYRPPPCIPSYNTPSPKSKETATGLLNSREQMNKGSLFRWLFENQHSKKNYGYSSIMPQPLRESSEPPKPTYPTRTSLPMHQPAYVTSIHSTEQHKSAYDEEKHYLRPNPNTVHGIPIQQPQGASTGGITTGFPVRAPAVIQYQPPLHTPVTYDDITLSRILHNQSFKSRMSYNKSGL